MEFASVSHIMWFWDLKAAYLCGGENEWFSLCELALPSLLPSPHIPMCCGASCSRNSLGMKCHHLKLVSHTFGRRGGENLKSCRVAERLLVSTERFLKPQTPWWWSWGALKGGCWVCPRCFFFFFEEDLKIFCRLEFSSPPCPLQLDAGASSSSTGLYLTTHLQWLS